MAGVRSSDQALLQEGAQYRSPEENLRLAQTKVAPATAFYDNYSSGRSTKKPPQKLYGQLLQFRGTYEGVIEDLRKLQKFGERVSPEVFRGFESLISELNRLIDLHRSIYPEQETGAAVVPVTTHAVRDAIAQLSLSGSRAGASASVAPK